MRFLSKLTDHNLGNRIALLRVDFNIDFSAIRLGQDLLRLEAVLPTIKFLLERGAKVIILSHRGRPAPKRSEASKRVEFSLISFVSILEKKLKQKVGFTSNLSTSQVH
ncbi:MAG: phosphoglycerate kinase, partial [Candidatus Harrisonbacteria bacterium RIFCSPHIGHO2_01_FULL_44_13]